MIYQRKDSPFWWYKFAVNGRTYQGSTKRESKKDATRYASRLYEEKLGASQFGDRPTITIGEAMRLTVEEKEGRTREMYDHFRRKLLGMGSFSKAFHLDPAAVLDTLDAQTLMRLDMDRKRQGLAINTRNHEKTFLRLTIRRAKAWGFKTPTLDFEMGKAKAKTRWLRDHEEMSLLEYLGLKSEGSDTWADAYDLAVFLLDTGARLNEALKLPWTRVNLTDGVITLWRFKGDIETAIGITPRVRAVLDRRRNYPSPFGGIGRAVTYLRRAIAEVCNGDAEAVATAGKATIHSLRDTFATRLHREGLDIRGISYLLGHKSLAMTVKYTHSDEAVAYKAATLLWERYVSATQ